MSCDAPLPRVRILGGDVDVVTPRDMMGFVDLLVRAGASAVIANHNAHSLFLIRRSAALRAFFDDADLIQIDSTPMIAWGRALGLPVARRHRSTYLDYRDAFWPLANERGWRVFYLGGEPGVALAAAERLSQAWPKVTLGVRDGYFDAAAGSADNAAVVAAIRAFEPDVLFVGMGMPRQELWIADNRDAFDRGVILPVGAAFDYEAGVQKTPPRWTGRLGVEWLFRLAAEPRRLASRYLVEPLFLLGPALADVGAALTARRAGAEAPLRG